MKKNKKKKRKKRVTLFKNFSGLRLFKVLQECYNFIRILNCLVEMIRSLILPLNPNNNFTNPQMLNNYSKPVTKSITVSKNSYTQFRFKNFEVEYKLNKVIKFMLKEEEL